MRPFRYTTVGRLTCTCAIRIKVSIRPVSQLVVNAYTDSLKGRVCFRRFYVRRQVFKLFARTDRRLFVLMLLASEQTNVVHLVRPSTQCPYESVLSSVL